MQPSFPEDLLLLENKQDDVSSNLVYSGGTASHFKTTGFQNIFFNIFVLSKIHVILAKASL